MVVQRNPEAPLMDYYESENRWEDFYNISYKGFDLTVYPAKDHYFGNHEIKSPDGFFVLIMRDKVELLDYVKLYSSSPTKFPSFETPEEAVIYGMVYIITYLDNIKTERK